MSIFFYLQSPSITSRRRLDLRLECVLSIFSFDYPRARGAAAVATTAPAATVAAASLESFFSLRLAFCNRLLVRMRSILSLLSSSGPPFFAFVVPTPAGTDAASVAWSAARATVVLSASKSFLGGPSSLRPSFSLFDDDDDLPSRMPTLPPRTSSLTKWMSLSSSFPGRPPFLLLLLILLFARCFRIASRWFRLARPMPCGKQRREIELPYILLLGVGAGSGPIIIKS